KPFLLPLWERVPEGRMRGGEPPRASSMRLKTPHPSRPDGRSTFSHKRRREGDDWDDRGVLVTSTSAAHGRDPWAGRGAIVVSGFAEGGPRIGSAGSTVGVEALRALFAT